MFNLLLRKMKKILNVSYLRSRNLKIFGIFAKRNYCTIQNRSLLIVCQSTHRLIKHDDDGFAHFLGGNPKRGAFNLYFVISLCAKWPKTDL